MKDIKGFSSIDSTYNDGNNIYRLTDDGIQNIETYIAELQKELENKQKALDEAMELLKAQLK